MKLTVPEVASILGSTEKRVYEWIVESGLPAQRIRGQFRINRTDLLEWATDHGMGVSPRAFSRERGTPSLAGALRAGGVHREIGGGDLQTVIRSIVALLPVVPDADRDMLLHVLLARDALGVTPVGDGIAIPHVRTPIVLAQADAVLALSFLTQPFELGAPDGRPVDTFFLLICPTIRVHLAMLAKLAFGLKDEAFHAAVRGRAPTEEIVRLAAALEGAF